MKTKITTTNFANKQWLYLEDKKSFFFFKDWNYLWGTGGECGLEVGSRDKSSFFTLHVCMHVCVYISTYVGKYVCIWVMRRCVPQSSSQQSQCHAGLQSHGVEGGA